MPNQSRPNLVPSVTSPPDGVPPAPPVTTRPQRLPFGELSWENFERVCHRLMSLEGDVEHCARYGRQGDAQAGIDVYARHASGRYHCLQAKRHKDFSAGQIRDAVDLFLAGHWASRATRFTIAVQSSLRSTAVQDEIEAQAARLSAVGIAFVALDGEDLTNQLRLHPQLVDDYFGRPWVHALLGAEAVAALKGRLDGADFTKARSQLTRVYESHFHSVDPGSFGSVVDEGRTELTLLERFLKPDILVREASGPQERSDGQTSGEARGGPLSAAHAPTDRPSAHASSPINRLRRLPFDEWIGEAQRLVVLGDAGGGKSTLLRVIALDLLHDQTQFPELAARWGQRLPLYLPFARWTAQTARTGGTVGIKEMVRRSLDPLLTGPLANLIDQCIEDGRVLLLVDGLDEWSNEQAARTTLNALITLVEAHGVPVVVSGRPRGLDKIGSIPAAWRRGTIAPLSVAQQASIASRWFSRFSSDDARGGMSVASLRTGRFMAELARDANLAALASTPLLLIGLVTLALRGQILPRTRNDIYDQLVRVLLEVHPSNRATAAGDTESRFRYANDPDQRRAAIAHLAFVIRAEAGGGAMSLAAARDTLQAFLVSPQGFALGISEAARAAGEILAVNAETQGLIVEKGPGELGFVHASFEEYLSAEHLGSWSFDAISTFVRVHAGQGRWRNAITHLLGRLQRRDEVDRLVEVIEEDRVDELSRLNCLALLGDIAFGLPARAGATAKRLALATMQRVESEDWMPARREALGSVLRGVNDPALKSEVVHHLARWVPGRGTWPAALVEALGSWEPTPALQDTLYRAMHHEDPYAQRAAAKAFAKAFSSSDAARQRLVDGLARSRDLNSSAALLECLAHGWPTAPSAISLFQQAYESHRGAVRLVGALGLAAGGTRRSEMRDLVLTAQSFWSSLSLSHRNLAAEMLARFWPDEPELIEGAVNRLSGYSHSTWDYSTAHVYLLACDIRQPKVRSWILQELSSDYPFNFHSGEDRVWDQVGQLAAIDTEVRRAANTYWQDPKRRLIGMHKLEAYVAHVADPELAAVLRGVILSKDDSFNRYWALKALLVGWGREHVEVRPTVDALIASPDEDLEELVSLLPSLYADKAQARDRLLRMGQRANVRRDLLTEGLSQSGCNGSDDEAVHAVLRHRAERGSIYTLSHALFERFGEHPAVRAFAVESLRAPDTPLTAIAAGYANDPDFGQLLMDAAIPLPVELRTQVVEFAAEGSTGTPLEAVLSQARLESDPELRVRMEMARHAHLSEVARAEARPELLARAVAVGTNFDVERASALAGLTVIGALEGLVELQEREKPLQLQTGKHSSPMPSLERQICERFADFESAFGPDLPRRLDGFGNRSRLAEILTTAPGASPAARAAFRTIAERGELPMTVEATRALAAERPGSALLLEHCWKVLERKEQNNTGATVNGQIALVLRTHFPDDTEVQKRLVAMYVRSPRAATAICLAVYAPHASELQFQHQDLGRDFGDWSVAIHVAARRASAHEFADLLEAMVTRDFRTQFNVQELINLAVQERLQRDAELVELLSARLRSDVDRSISGSFARYLAAAGRLGPNVQAKAAELLRAVAAEQSLPLAGYDAIADEWRATRATLLDALSSGLELN